MTRLEKIERDIATLSDEEFRKLADWVADRRNALWDARIEEDAAAGRLDSLSGQALAAHRSGRTREI